MRSLRHAKAAETALRARVIQATEQIKALNQRGRGGKRFQTMAALRRAVVAILKRYGYNGFCGICSTPFMEPEISKFSSQLSA
jgi:hypothetical protein